MSEAKITAEQAWEAVERLKLDVSHSRLGGEWCASRCDSPRYELGWGATPIEAVANLLERIGETAQKVEVANA